MKTSENLTFFIPWVRNVKFSDVFRGIKREHWEERVQRLTQTALEVAWTKTVPSFFYNRNTSREYRKKWTTGKRFGWKCETLTKPSGVTVLSCCKKFHRTSIVQSFISVKLLLEILLRNGFIIDVFLSFEMIQMDFLLKICEQVLQILNKYCFF